MALVRPGGPMPPAQSGGATPPPGAHPPTGFPPGGDYGGPAYRPPAGFNPNVQIGGHGTVVGAPGMGGSWALGQPPGQFVPTGSYNTGGHALTGGQNPTHLALVNHLQNGTTAGGYPPGWNPGSWNPGGNNTAGNPGEGPMGGGWTGDPYGPPDRLGGGYMGGPRNWFGPPPPPPAYQNALSSLVDYMRGGVGVPPTAV